MMPGGCSNHGCARPPVVAVRLAAELPGGEAATIDGMSCALCLEGFFQHLRTYTYESLALPLPAEPDSVEDPDDPHPYVVVDVDAHDRVLGIAKVCTSYSEALLTAGAWQKVGARAWAEAALADTQLLQALADHADDDPSLKGTREILSGPYREQTVRP